MPLSVDEGYWTGATWVYQSDIANGAGGAGVQSVTVVPGAGNELEFLYGSIVNAAGANEEFEAKITDDDDNFIVTIAKDKVVADTNAMNYPAAPGGGNSGDDPFGSAAGRYIVSGTMKLVFITTSISASQNCQFAMTCRVRGGAPTATESGASTPVITINKEQVF